MDSKLKDLEDKQKEHDSKIKENENNIMLLKSLSNSGGDGSAGDGESKKGVLDALEILVENLRKECYAMFAGKEEFNDLKERVESLERDNDKNKKQIDSNLNDLNKHEGLIKKNEEEIEALKKLLKDYLDQKSSGANNSSNLGDISDLLKKLADL